MSGAPAVARGPSADFLATRFSLTGAEARTAAALIVGGLKPKEIAQVRQVALATVRSQVQSIYAKVGCSSRGALSALAWSAYLSSQFATVPA